MTEEQIEAVWLERVESLFLRHGIKSQTMDDISRELGISKKTLYQMVENKDDLVRRVLEHHISREKSQCLSMAAQATDAVDEMLMIVDSNSQDFAQMKANVLYELQKYHHDAFRLIVSFQREFLYKLVVANLERGRAEGLYRTDFDIDVVARLHLASVMTLFDEEVFPSASITREVLFREYMMHYLHGIVSDKGLKVLRSKLQKI